jgi:hypothetical protein
MQGQIEKLESRPRPWMRPGAHGCAVREWAMDQFHFPGGFDEKTMKKFNYVLSILVLFFMMISRLIP